MDDPNVASNKQARGRRAKGALRLTGTANALTRGNGRKVGLRRRAGLAPVSAPRNAERGTRQQRPAPVPESMRQRPTPFVPGGPSRGPAPAPAQPRPGRIGKPSSPPTPYLTGTANAVTRGEGRKVGLRRNLGMTPPPPPKPMQKGRAKR